MVLLGSGSGDLPGPGLFSPWRQSVVTHSCTRTSLGVKSRGTSVYTHTHIPFLQSRSCSGSARPSAARPRGPSPAPGFSLLLRGMFHFPSTSPLPPPVPSLAPFPPGLTPSRFRPRSRSRLGWRVLAGGDATRHRRAVQRWPRTLVGGGGGLLEGVQGQVGGWGRGLSQCVCRKTHMAPLPPPPRVKGGETQTLSCCQGLRSVSGSIPIEPIDYS